eukprot:TRINITY_DN3857_c0_g1_i1.p1 TRINITY_DN3857_c0_g1~~TRINITY_DN3857_c0_g1_i1.p1  ORF type:complete len:376 (-),score=65.04 TRINITY_DN3857_c0_g1_i1:92-1099(-)
MEKEIENEALVSDNLPLEHDERMLDDNMSLISTLWYHGWKPTNEKILENSEKQILKVLDNDFKQFNVKCGDYEINTVKIGSGPPLVMLHGFGGGVALWIANLDHLAKFYTIYAIDLLGFGRSTRKVCSGNTPEEAEKFFLDSLEAWRKEVGLEKFNLLGHSFGGFLSACYALQNPQLVEKLILADPWGFPKKPDNAHADMPWRFKVVVNLMSWLPSPLSLLRAIGPWGPSMINRVRPDLERKFSHLFQDNPQILSKYIYHCNAQNPTGEMAFSTLQIPFGWARRPLVERLQDLSPSVPLYFVYGKKTWMDVDSVLKMKKDFKGHVEIALLPHVCI